MAEDKSGLPVDRGWAWMIVLGYFISVFCMVGIAKSFGILLEEFVVYFDIPVALAALIMGICGGVYTIAAPICVAAGQHFSQRKVVMLGGVVGAIGLSLSGLLLSIEWVIVMFGGLYGFGNACIFGNGLVILGQYFNKRRSIANGLSLSGASVGQFVIPPLLQLLLDTYGLQGTLIVIGAMYLNVVVCGALYRPAKSYTAMKVNKRDIPEEEKLIEGPHSRNRNQIVKKEGNDVNDKTGGFVMSSKTGDLGDLDIEIEVFPDTSCNGHKAADKLTGSGDDETESFVRYRTSDTGSVVIGSVDSLHTIAIEDQSKSKMTADKNEKSSSMDCKRFLTGLLDFSVLRNYVVRLFVVMSFLLFFGHFNFIVFMPATAFTKGVSKYDKAYLVSITGACDLCGRILIGVAGDLNLIARYKLMGSATLLCGMAILGFIYAEVYWLMAVCIGLYGFFGGCYVSINAPVLIDFVGLKHMPKALGVVLFIQGLGAAIGQPALGAIRDSMGSYVVVNYINCFCLVGGSILLFMYPMVKKMEEKRTVSLNTDCE